jgi:DNA-binding SARP family transcriptional activator
LRIRLLGAITNPLMAAGGYRARKRRALLGYLALREGSEVARGALSQGSCGASGARANRASLRQTLSELKGALGKTASSSILASREAITGHRIGADRRPGWSSAAGLRDDCALREISRVGRRAYGGFVYAR